MEDAPRSPRSPTPASSTTTAGTSRCNTALQGGVDIDVFFTYDSSNLAMRSYPAWPRISAIWCAPPLELEPFLDTGGAEGPHRRRTRSRRWPPTKEPERPAVQRGPPGGGRDRASHAAWDRRGVPRGGPRSGRRRTATAPTCCRTSPASSWARITRYADGGDSNFEHPAFLDHFELAAQMIREGAALPLVAGSRPADRGLPAEQLHRRGLRDLGHRSLFACGSSTIQRGVPARLPHLRARCRPWTS